MPNLPPPPAPAKGGSKGVGKNLSPPRAPQEKPQAPPSGPPVQVPADLPGTLRSAAGSDSEELFEDGLQWTRILKSTPEKSTQGGSQQGDDEKSQGSSFASSEEGEKIAAEEQGESATSARSDNGGGSDEDQAEGDSRPNNESEGLMSEELEELASANIRKRTPNGPHPFQGSKTKSILKQTTMTTEEVDPILTLLSGELGSDWSPSGRNREPKVKIVDDQEEQRAQRQALRLLEAKAHEKELRMKRRSQMIVWLLMLPVRSVTYLGSCCISSPKTRQLWLLVNLAVSLFELWTCALFWAFSMDSKKLTILGVLLTADHWVNAWFLVDAMLQALDQLRGPEAPDGNESRVIVMRKVDWREQMQQKAKSMFQKLPGFSACSTEFLSKIADVGEVLTKQKGDVLYGEQEDNTSFYLILHGEVVVRDGDHVNYVGPGGTLGEFKVFDMVQADSSHVECISECAIFEVSEREMKRGLESSPADRNMLLEFFKAKLSDANKKHGDGKWDMMRKGARTLFRPIVLFMESGVHGSRDIWLQAGFAIVLLVLGNFAGGILHAANNDLKERSVNQNFFWILFLICKLMRQKLPLTYLKRFFVEQETQLYVNIRLTGSGGSTWVTLKLAVIMLGWGHWIGCLYLLVALARPTPDTGTEDSMFDQFREKAYVPIYDDEDWWGDYLIAYYRAFNKNYEGSKPERLEELILQLFVVCGILAMKSYVIGSFFKLQEAKKESSREVEQLLNQADMVCNTLDLPPSIRKSIRQYCLFQWSKSRDVGNRDMVLKTFAPDLQKKVKEQIYLPIIQANEVLFHGVTSDFMLQIIDHLEVTVLQPSELLFCESDAPQELCFLETGTLMLTCQEQLVRYARSDRPNEPTAIGEVAFVLKVPHLYSVRSRSGVESSILRMSRTDFEMIMAHLDSDHDQLLQNAAHAMRLSLNGNDIKGDAIHDGQEDTELFQMMRESVRQVLLNRTAHISTTFITAAAEGNVEQVELLLRKRVLVDTGNSDGRTAMHLAASEGRDQIMKLLIKAEGNVNLQDRWKGTPLRDAVMGKFSAVIEVLMDQHADLNLEDPATALCDAASSGNLMALQELIEVKIDPNSGDYDLRTALHLAASEGKLEVISFLLDARADPNFKDRWGGTALEDAIQNNHAVAAQLIFSKKGGLRQDLAAGWLCDAAAAGNIIKLQQLTENSVDVNSGDYDARTALHLAATEGQLLAVSYLIGSARAFTSPQDRWRSTPLQDAVRAGHTDCARLLAFTGGFLGDSATDEDREKLSGIISEDFSSPNTWPEVQKFQRRMNELNQRVSRLLVAVAKGKARPEVFDAVACTKFNRQLICAVFKQCPQLADSMLALALIFRRLYADALVPLQSFMNLLQDSVDCTKHSKWWLWYAKQGKEERRQSAVKAMREPKIEKSASAITKLLVQTMQIGKQVVDVVNAAGKNIYVQINREVNARRIDRKDYVIDEAYLALRAAASNTTSQTGKSQTTKKRRKSFTGSLARTPSNHSRNTGKKEEAEDSRSQGNHLVLSEVCTECVFEALGWDVDWAAPASSNYGINAGAMKQQLEELGKVLASSQAGAVMEMWQCLTTLPVRPFDPGAWRSERQARCCAADSTEVTSIFGKGTYLKPMSLPLALELAMLSVLALVRTAPLNIEAQPSREETLTRIDICFLRNGLEAVEMEVRGDIAKTQREVLKKRDPSRTPGKKVIHMGGRFARVEPVSIGRILATQRDLSTDDLCAIIDAQDSTCQISAKMDEEDSDEDGKKRVDRKVTLRKDNKHILSHQSSFGVMSPERFQLNVLRHLLDFNSLQVDAMEADERRRQEGVTDALEEDPFDEDFCFREVLSSGEVVWYDDKYIEEMEDLEGEGNSSSDSELEESDDLDGLGSDAQGSSPRSSPASPTHSISRRVMKRDGTEDKKAKSLWAKALLWFQSKQALFGKARDQEARLRQKVARKFRELDEDGEGLHLADVATLLTDVLGHQLDRDAMLRLAANVYDAVEKSEQELMQLSEIQDVLETATQDYEAMVKRQRQHSSQKQGANSNGGWVWVQRLAGYVMPPDAMFLVLWDYVKSAVVIYYLIEVPMRFCMVNFDYLDDTSTLALIAANIGADVFMLANLPLNFLRGFEDTSGLVIRDFEQIRRRYLLGAFSWDLIAALPFDIFADPLLNAERTYATWRLLKLIHLRHLWGRRTESKSSDQQDYGFALTTVIVLLNFCVLGHVMGCIYWYIGNGWPTLQQLEEQLATPERHTWFANYQGMDYKFGTVNQPSVSVFEQYILSLYSMINILINDNNDILNPASWGELGWILGSFVVSVAVMGAIDGTLVGKVISQDESVVEQRVMKARINTFIKNAGLPNELAEQILVSEGGGDRQRGGQGHSAADARTLETVLSSLSHSLLQRIGRRVFLKWLSALPIFKDCSEPFLLQLTTTCRPLSVAAGSFLCRAGELTSFFFILRSGSVQLRDSSNEEVDRIDERGTALCDISCLFGLRHEISVISEEESGFIKVPMEELNTALLLYPKDQEVIHNNVFKLTPNPSKDGQDDTENQVLGATWAEDEEDMGKSQVSASTKRKKRKLAGLVDLMADLPAHDLSLDGVARVRKEIKKFQKTQEQERIGDFMAFAAQGKWEAMEAMLRSNKVHVNCTNWDGRTALHVAVSAGHLNVVEKLVMDFSALFTVPDRFGHTPLDDSVRERHSEAAEFLIEANAEFKSGVSAAVQLCEAAANGDTAQLELLVEVIGVDPNLGDYDDRTALHLAASNGHLDTIQKMLDFPALDLSPFDRFELTPLDDAIRHGHVQVQKLLKHEGAQMGKVEFGVSLCEAASENDHNKIRQMIEAGVRAGMADYDYRTALHLAASNGHLETCVFLLREGKVDPNPLDRFLHTPLDDAIRHEHLDVVQLLVKYRGRPSSDEEYLGRARNDFIKTMAEENDRKDSDKLEKELKTHGFVDLLERIARFRTEVEEEAHSVTACANNIRYDLCRILHASVLLNDENPNSGSEKLHRQIMLEEGATIQRLRYLMEKDLKTLDSSAVKILELFDTELMPWLNSLRSNTHTKGLLPLLLPNIFEDMEKLSAVLRHVKTLLPQLLTKVTTGTAGVGYDCKPFGLLCCRFLQPRSSDLQDLLGKALTLLVEQKNGKETSVTPWPGGAKVQKLFRTSNLVECLTCGLDPPPFKPQEIGKRDAAAQQEDESI